MHLNKPGSATNEHVGLQHSVIITDEVKTAGVPPPLPLTSPPPPSVPQNISPKGITFCFWLQKKPQIAISTSFNPNVDHALKWCWETLPCICCCRGTVCTARSGVWVSSCAGILRLPTRSPLLLCRAAWTLPGRWNRTDPAVLPASGPVRQKEKFVGWVN